MSELETALNSLTCIDFPFQHVQALRAVCRRPPVLRVALPSLCVSHVWPACSRRAGGRKGGRLSCRCWREHCLLLRSERPLPGRDRRPLRAAPGVHGDAASASLRALLSPLAGPPGLRRAPPGLCGAALRARRRQCRPGLGSHSAGSEQIVKGSRTGAAARADPRQAACWVLRAWGAPAGAGGLREEVELAGCSGPCCPAPPRLGVGLVRAWAGGLERAPGRVSAGQAGGAKAGLQLPSVSLPSPLSPACKTVRWGVRMSA